MTPRALRHVSALVLVGGLLLGVLSVTGARAELGTTSNGTPVEDNGANENATEVAVDGDDELNVSAEGSANEQKYTLREHLNITRILEMAGKEAPLLRQHRGIVRESGTGQGTAGIPVNAGRLLGELKPIFGGAVNVSWLVRIQLLSGDGRPLPGATVLIVDGLGIIVAALMTDDSGMTPSIVLIEARISGAGAQHLNPYTVVVDGGGDIQEFPMLVESDGTMIFVMQLPMAGEPIGAIAYAAAAFAAIAGCMVTPLSFERTRYALSIPIIPLYSKLRKEEIIGQSTRVRILDYIELHPGEHFGAIKKALCLSNGNAIYHLRFLEKQGLIKSRVSGIFRRFYARDFTPPDNGEAYLAG